MPSPIPHAQHPEVAKLKRGDVVLLKGRVRIVISTYRSSVLVVRSSYIRGVDSSRSCVRAFVDVSVKMREEGITVVTDGARIPACRCTIHLRNGDCEKGDDVKP